MVSRLRLRDRAIVLLLLPWVAIGFAVSFIKFGMSMGDLERRKFTAWFVKGNK